MVLILSNIHSRSLPWYAWVDPQAIANFEPFKAYRSGSFLLSYYVSHIITLLDINIYNTVYYA